MNGMELAEGYYKEYGEPLLRGEFSEYAPLIAAGLAGEGSECFGYDDEISRDHDFGPGFCFWITEKTARDIGGKLQEAYRGLPAEYGGVTRIETPEGAGRVGVITIEDFYRKYIGCPGAPGNVLDWFRIPERYLAIVTSGKVFRDPEGTFTEIRETLLGFYPEDVLRKKLAARAAVMAQSGQYNFPRSLKRGEKEAAWMALHEFVKAALSAIFLLNREYAPFYKWIFRRAGELTILQDTVTSLMKLVDMSVSEDGAWMTEMIEDICVSIEREIVRQGFAETHDQFMQAYCPDIMAGIKDPQLAGLPAIYDID